MVERLGERELVLHYYSTRKGLTEFVVGLINGLAKMFSESIEIKLLKSEYTDVWHDVFHVRIIN